MEDLEKAKKFINEYSSLPKDEVPVKSVKDILNAQQLIIFEGSAKDRFLYVTLFYVEDEIEYDRKYLSKREREFFRDKISMERFLDEIDFFNSKIKVYNDLCKHYEIDKYFPKYEITNEIVKITIGDRYG